MTYIEQCDRLLLDKYALTLADTGFDAKEWLVTFGPNVHEHPNEAVDAFARKYHLDPIPQHL